MKNESSRKYQKKVACIIVIVTIVAVVLTIIITNTRAKSKETILEQSTTQKIEQTVEQNDITNDDDDTLIKAIVNKVISPKEIEVIVNGVKKEISLIGINVSKEKHEETMKYLNTIIVPNMTVYLLYDVDTTNSKGQEACYVWFNTDTGLELYSSCTNNMLQGVLIAKGLAKPVEEYPNSRYETTFGLIYENMLNDEV